MEGPVNFMATYWSKIIRDLYDNKFQSILVILAISIGIFGAGSITTSYAVLNYEIDANYLATSPPDFTLYSHGFNGSSPAIASHLAGIKNAEFRLQILSRWNVDGEWRPLMLTIVDELKSLEIATVTLENGSWPMLGQMVIERSSVSITYVHASQDIEVKVPGEDSYSIGISGTVHDAAQAPGWQDGIDYGYISLSTLQQSGYKGYFNQLLFHVQGDNHDRNYRIQVAKKTQHSLEVMGYSIYNVMVPETNGHPHRDQMNSLIFLIQVFAVLTQLLSGILVYITMSSLLRRQMKEIGIMKTIGGNNRNLNRIFYSYVTVFAVISLSIGLPTGNWVGKLYASLIAALLNFDITKDTIPLWVYIVEVVVGLIIPLLSSAIPIRKACSIPAVEAIRTQGRADLTDNPSIMGTERLGFISTLSLLSLRNVFRRRTRLFLLLLILTLGGSIFISALNVGTSWTYTIDQAAAASKYDIKVNFNQPYTVNDIDTFLGGISEIQRYETWQQLSAIHTDTSETQGLRFKLIGVPPDTNMIDFPLLEGRWFRENDTNAMVINHELFYDEHTNIQPGDTLDLLVGNRTISWHVIGVIKEVGAPRRGYGTPATSYVNKEYLDRELEEVNQTNSLRIKVKDGVDVEQLKNNLELTLDKSGFDIVSIQTSSERLVILRDHLAVILLFLFIMATLILGVGGLSLISTTSISIIERSREIGILRTLGARGSVIIRSFIFEGLIIGGLSYTLSALISIAMTKVIGDYAAWIFVQSNIMLKTNNVAYLSWILIVVLIVTTMTYFPARRATERPINEVIAFE